MEPKNWMQELLDIRKAGTAHYFVLHGNIYDLHRNRAGRYIDLCEYLAETFAACRLMFYSLSGGLRFTSEENENWFKENYLKQKPASAPSEAEKVRAEMEKNTMRAPINEIFDRDPDKALPFFERVLADRKADETRKLVEKRILVVECAQNLAPAFAGTTAMKEDRINAETFERWARDARFRAAGSAVILVTPLLGALAACARSTDVGARTIRIPKPSVENREARWQYWLDQKLSVIEDDLTADMLARFSNGLSLRQIDSAVTESAVRAEKISLATLRVMKQNMLEAEMGGRVKVKVPEYGLDYLGGKKKLKSYFAELMKFIREGEYWALPMGILAAGPPGTGKTFAFECFAYDCGYTVLYPGNLRGRYVGESEMNTEQLLQTAYDLRPSLVVEDEADQSETSRDSWNGDTGVSNRMRQMKFDFCGDQRNRGHVIWVRITNRDDLIDGAYKRKGRTDDKLCFLLPDLEELTDTFRVKFKQHNLAREKGLDDFTELAQKALEKIYFTGADADWVVLNAGKIARRDKRKIVTKKDLFTAFDGWETDADEDEYDRQTLFALKGSLEDQRPDNWQKIKADTEARMAARRKAATVH